MDIEKIVECSAAELKAMTDAELLQHFQKYLIVTRPELATKPKQTTITEAPIDPKKKAALAMLAGEGIDLSFLKKKQYRK